MDSMNVPVGSTSEAPIFATVSRAIAESLAIPIADIQPESRLIDDLGADSLDFVDLVFTLDREFDIRARETEFNFLTRLDFSSPDVMSNGYLTEAVVDRLSRWLTAIGTLPDRTKISPRELFSLITVESICAVVERRLIELGRRG
jgi:acyl carrier protein